MSNFSIREATARGVPMLSFKRRMLERFVRLRAAMTPNGPLPAEPESIFALQPAHIGDLLVDTPLFAVLRKLYPKTKLVIGTGSWTFGAIENNPNITEMVHVPCPWNNIYTKPNTTRGAMQFIYGSQIIKDLRKRKFSMGIDLCGTQFDSLILLRLEIPYRVGIYGPGGGFTAFQKTANYDEYDPMARTALRLAETLGARDLPPIEPQIFLTDAEKARGHELWAKAQAIGRGQRRVVIGPAASVNLKCWPLENFRELVGTLAKDPDVQIVLVGGHDVVEVCRDLAKLSPRICNLGGDLKLRETFGLVHAAELVISNSNMLMHTAAAFGLPAVVVLGNLYDSAAQHKIQWGYPSSIVLGKEKDHPELYRAPEVLAIVRQVLAKSGMTAAS